MINFINSIYQWTTHVFCPLFCKSLVCIFIFFVALFVVIAIMGILWFLFDFFVLDTIREKRRKDEK